MSGITNRWLEKVPAKTIKGNDSVSAGQVKDLSVTETIALLGGIENLLDTLPDADLAKMPQHVIINQEPDIWAKMSIAGFMDWLYAIEHFYVSLDYVLTGYILEGIDEQQYVLPDYVLTNYILEG